MDRKLEILLVEDDKTACDKIIREIDNNPDDFCLIGVTNNSSNAFQYIIDTRPDAVILDLELHLGGGDGLELLKRLKDFQPIQMPFILVTTNNISSFTHKIARQLGADFIMTKTQEGYSAQKVLEFLKIAKSVILSRKAENHLQNTDDTITQKDKRINRILCAELNKVGISPKSVGYEYLIEAITSTIQNKPQHICSLIAKKYGKSENSVERAMQNAINRAWKNSDINDLLYNYTAKISTERGAPTLMEFISYYSQKIKSQLL